VERRTAVQDDTNALLRSVKAVAVLRTRKDPSTAGRSWSSQRSSTPRGWSCPSASARCRFAGAHTKDHARKALRKLVGPRLPASLRQLETAVKRADAEYARAERQAHDARRTAAESPSETDPGQDASDSVDPEVDVDGELADEDRDELA
jgi:hypothetical protein